MRIGLAATLAGLGLALAGCGGGTADTGDTADSGEMAASSPSAEESPAGPATADLGQTHEWEDGFAVTVTPVERFNEGDRGYSGDADYVQLDVVFHNGSDAPVELDRVGTSCQVEGTEVGDEAFDDLAYEWPSMLQPGADGTWQPACEMGPDESELQFMVEVFQPGDDLEASYPAVYFAGDVQ